MKIKSYKIKHILFYGVKNKEKVPEFRSAYHNGPEGLSSLSA